MTKRTHLLAASASVFALLSTTPAAFAQDAADEDVIIISATKRNTTLQDTPVAVTVTTAETIERAQIFDIKDLQSVVPTFRVSQLQNSSNTSLIIRGFGNGSNNVGIEPSVGLFIDGVYRSRAAAQISDLPNLERVEVLAGPQSTLFGKNASAGVVSVVTAKPEFETTGYVEGGVGNFDLNYAKGYITGPISDTLAVSLGIGYQDRDGYFDAAEGTRDDDFNDLGRFNYRAQALWQPTDNLTARLIVDRSTLDENCCGVTTAVAGPTALAIQSLGGQIASAEDPFSFETAVNRETDNSIRDKGVSLQLDYDTDLFGGATFTSISSYRRNSNDFTSDSDFTSLELLEDTFQFVDIDTYTQEARITSTSSGPLQWLVGGFYFNENIDQNSGLDFGDDLRNYIDILAGGPAAIGAVEATAGLAPGTAFGDQVFIDETFRQDNEAYSIFGTVDYKFFDRLTLSVGANYTNDRKDVSASTVNNDLFSDIVLQDNPGTGLLAQGAIAAAFGASDNPADDNFDPIALAFTNLFIGSPLEGNFPLTAANFASFDAVAGAGAQAGFTEGVRQTVISGLEPLQFQPQFLSFPNSVEDGRTRDDKFTYTAKAAFEVNDNFNVYGSYATGYKASSFNLTRDSRPFISDALALQAAGLLPNNFVFGLEDGTTVTNATPADSIPDDAVVDTDSPVNRNFGTRFAAPEEVRVFEIGLKARFDWGAFNVAAFDQRIDDFQSTLFQGTGFVLANAGRQSSRGIEFDSTFNPFDGTSFEGLSFGIAGIIQDPEFDDFTGAPVVTGGELDLADGQEDGVGDLSGQTPAGINNVSLSFSGQYERPITESVDAYIRADFQYEDEVQVVDNIAGVDRDTRLLNGAIGFTLNDSLDIRFWGRNITNHETFTSAFPGVVQAGTVSAYPNQPRTYGVAVRKSF